MSLVDGLRGRLIYRGYAIRELAERARFAEVIHLLLAGKLPDRGELDETRAALAAERALPEPVLAMLRTRPRDADPMDVLQGAVTALADHDPDRGTDDRGRAMRSCLRLIARTASAAAAWHHLRAGREPPPPADDETHAGAFLRALWGRAPTADETRLMDILLVIHAEHTLNASTFAVREVASTRANLYASVAAGVGALSGPLHGGANSRVMEMLRSIGDEDQVESWVRARIEAGERIMGLGHAVYKVKDPRAIVLERVAKETLAGTENERWFRLALKVEEVAVRLLDELKGKQLYPNVDFYSGGVLHALGLEAALFPVFFAVSRVAGWCAHYLEERFAEAQPKAVIYRPRAHYVGRYCGPEGCVFVPLDERGERCPCGKNLGGCQGDHEPQKMR